MRQLVVTSITVVFILACQGTKGGRDTVAQPPAEQEESKEITQTAPEPREPSTERPAPPQPITSAPPTDDRLSQQLADTLSRAQSLLDHEPKLASPEARQRLETAVSQGEEDPDFHLETLLEAITIFEQTARLPLPLLQDNVAKLESHLRKKVDENITPNIHFETREIIASAKTTLSKALNLEWYTVEEITTLNTELQEIISSFELNSHKLEELRNAHELANHLNLTSPDSLKNRLADFDRLSYIRALEPQKEDPILYQGRIQVSNNCLTAQQLESEETCHKGLSQHWYLTLSGSVGQVDGLQFTHCITFDQEAGRFTNEPACLSSFEPPPEYYKWKWQQAETPEHGFERGAFHTSFNQLQTTRQRFEEVFKDVRVENGHLNLDHNGLPNYETTLEASRDFSSLVELPQEFKSKAQTLRQYKLTARIIKGGKCLTSQGSDRKLTYEHCLHPAKQSFTLGIDGQIKLRDQPNLCIQGTTEFRITPCENSNTVRVGQKLWDSQHSLFLKKGGQKLIVSDTFGNHDSPSFFLKPEEQDNPLRAIGVKYGKFVDQISLLGEYAAIGTAGGKGGQPNIINLVGIDHHNEPYHYYISRVEVCKGLHVSGLRQRRVIKGIKVTMAPTDGMEKTVSATIGDVNPGLPSFECRSFPSKTDTNLRIVGFHGNAGQYLDRLGVIMELSN